MDFCYMPPTIILFRETTCLPETLHVLTLTVIPYVYIEALVEAIPCCLLSSYHCRYCQWPG